jgi:hypothetical protein
MQLNKKALKAALAGAALLASAGVAMAAPGFATTTFAPGRVPATPQSIPYAVVNASM